MNPKSSGKYSSCSSGRAADMIEPTSNRMPSSVNSTGLKGSSRSSSGAGKGAGLAELFQAHATETYENQGLFERAYTSLVKNNNKDQSYRPVFRNNQILTFHSLYILDAQQTHHTYCLRTNSNITVNRPNVFKNHTIYSMPCL